MFGQRFVYPFGLRRFPVWRGRSNVCQQQGTLHVVLYGALLWGEREKQFVEAAHMLPCLCRTFLREVLRQGKHQRLALVEHINFLPLPLREGIGTVNAPYDHHGTQYEKDDGKETYLPERGLNVLQ